MKKLFVWAMVATLLMAGSAFASGFKANSNATAGAAFFTGAGPTTTNNDDSCDISTAPAATLLLPYFEVDFNSAQTTAQTTLFTVTNVTQLPQIAHVTIWTDWSYPVMDFNLFLTGYDVQAINMYDILGPRAIIGSATGTTNSTDEGQRSLLNNANPHFLSSAATSCSLLPGPVPTNIIGDVRTALTNGLYASTCGTTRVGGTHANAIGYVTIDVAATCGTTLPFDPAYFSTEILFDNVLIGDYQQINPNPATGNYAGGNPLVHIRAVPEGGLAGQPAVLTNLPYTFYDRYTPAAARTFDRRQPLPSVFAARYIQGGTGAFNTNFKIWREGVTGPLAACSQYIRNSGTSTEMQVSDLVRFDEHENPTVNSSAIVISPRQTTTVIMPETSSQSSASGNFPPMSTLAGDVAGWMYLNLNNGGAAAYSTTVAGVSSATPNPTRPFNTGSTAANFARQNQDWVIISMFAEGRYSVDFDAAWLGNGCSPSAAVTDQNGGAPAIGPSPNATP